MNPAELIKVAKGEQTADLLLTNARIVNVFNGEIEEGNVAVYGDRIAGVGDYRDGKQVIDLGGSIVAPGFIDGHTHLESSMLDIGQYARAVVPRGTTSVVTDLHEIANVCGLEGIRYILDGAKRLPMDLFLMAPSCVPATHLETSGATIGTGEIRQLLRWKNCIGLGEVMNFPGVLMGDEAVMDKIASSSDKVIDGHAPGLTSRNLNAYVSAGIGSDHESVSLKEAEEKLRRGMRVMIREGSSEKNLDALLPLVTDKTYKRCMFVVDDRSCADLLSDGDIDDVVRKAVRKGLDPVRAIQMVTINTAEWFRLHDLGAVAPGYVANLVVIDNLDNLKIAMVFHHGKFAAEAGRPAFSVPGNSSTRLTNTINIRPFSLNALKLPANGDTHLVIQVVPGQIITRKRTETVKVKDGYIVPDTGRDILKLAVVERHRATGNIGRGLVTGFGLKRGALASSIAHDSHNIVAVGTSDEDIFAAVKELERIQGGLTVVSQGRVLGSLALPVAGLLSQEPLETVVAEFQRLETLAGDLGCKLTAPFSALSFLALPVIPELRLTDLGLVDVNEFKLVKS